MKYIYLFLGLLLFSCVKDEGNYTYTNHEVIIEGLSDQVMLDVIALKENLEIKPEVTFLIDGASEDDYNYEWRLIPMSLNEKPENGDKFIISTDKNLSYEITKESPGKYYGVYNVINKETGVIYYKPFYVNIRSMTSEGWAVLCDNNGKSRLDWIYSVNETDDEFLLDMWRDFPEYDEWVGSPVCLNFVYSLHASYRIVSGSKGSFNLMPQEPKMKEENNMIYQFGTDHERIDIRGGMLDISYNTAGSVMGLIDDKGDVYLKPTSAGSMFDYRMNRNFAWDPPFTYFRVAPYVAVADYKTGKSAAATVFYDIDGCRFVIMQSGIIKYLNPVSFPTTGIIMGPTKDCEMIFMETTQTNDSFALLRNKVTGKYYVYGFVLDSNAKQPRPTVFNELNIGAIDLSNIKGVSFNSLYSRIYVATENRVYTAALDLNTSGAVINLYDNNKFNFANEKIVKIFAPRYAAWRVYPEWQINIQNKLIVVSNDVTKPNDKCGVIRIYDTSMYGMDDIYKDYSGKGLGKIVDVEYFEVGL